jgi:hypothetical protein
VGAGCDQDKSKHKGLLACEDIGTRCKSRLMDWGCVEDRYCHFDWHRSVDIGRGCAALIRGWCRIREHLRDLNHVQETLLRGAKFSTLAARERPVVSGYLSLRTFKWR